MIAWIRSASCTRRSTPATIASRRRAPRRDVRDVQRERHQLRDVRAARPSPPPGAPPRHPLVADHVRPGSREPEPPGALGHQHVHHRRRSRRRPRRSRVRASTGDSPAVSGVFGISPGARVVSIDIRPHTAVSARSAAGSCRATPRPHARPRTPRRPPPLVARLADDRQAASAIGRRLRQLGGAAGEHQRLVDGHPFDIAPRGVQRRSGTPGRGPARS